MDFEFYEEFGSATFRRCFNKLIPHQREVDDNDKQNLQACLNNTQAAFTHMNKGIRKYAKNILVPGPTTRVYRTGPQAQEEEDDE